MQSDHDHKKAHWEEDRSSMRRCGRIIYYNIRRRRMLLGICCVATLFAVMVDVLRKTMRSAEPARRRVPLGMTGGRRGERYQRLNDVPGEWRGNDAQWLLASPNCKAVLEKSQVLPKVHYIEWEEVLDDRPLVGWEDSWISNGVFPSEYAPLSHRKVDFVYTWVNGSDTDFMALTAKWETNRDHIIGTNRVREWDELRYSVRAAFRNVNPNTFGKIHMIVKELSTKAKDDDAFLQTPTWLDTESETTEKYIRLVGESTLYDQTECLPTFNSISIEAQLHHVKNVTDGIFVALSDDMMLGRPFSDEDLHSPLFGIPLNPYIDSFLTNTLEEPTLKSVRLTKSESTERPPARFTSWLLNERFGYKTRTLVKHLPKLIDQSILKEAMSSFPQAAMQTPQYRFRGGGLQMSTWMLHAWFTMDRHREALLWSYVHLRCDKDQDGYLDSKEQQTILSEIQKGKKWATQVRNTSLAQMPTSWDDASIEPPKNHEVYWTSMDGPPTLRDINATFCEQVFNAAECLSPDFGRSGSSKVIAREVYAMVTQNDTCGDCLLMYLLAPHKVGFEPLLPSPSSTNSLRTKAIKAIMRYQYFLTTPSFEFLMIQGFRSGTDVFNRTAYKMPGFLCVNDDLSRVAGTYMMPRFKAMYKAFYEKVMPERSPVERE